jgi:hypothetical protein
MDKKTKQNLAALSLAFASIAPAFGQSVDMFPAQPGNPSDRLRKAFRDSCEMTILATKQNNAFTPIDSGVLVFVTPFTEKNGFMNPKQGRIVFDIPAEDVNESPQEAADACADEIVQESILQKSLGNDGTLVEFFRKTPRAPQTPSAPNPAATPSHRLSI